MRLIAAIALAFGSAVVPAAAEPLVTGSDRPPLVTGSETAPLVQQQPSYGARGQGFIPLRRYRLEERLRDLDRDSAQGDLDPFERRKRLETRQQLHELDRVLEKD